MAQVGVAHLEGTMADAVALRGRILLEKSELGQRLDQPVGDRRTQVHLPRQVAHADTFVVLRKLRQDLGVDLAYPTYREGLAALAPDG